MLKAEYYLRPRYIAGIFCLSLCAAIPFFAFLFDEPFYTSLFARLMIWAIAAVSLNLILGYGGMVSFGHAVYLGIGGYAVGICAYHEIYNAYIQWAIGILASAILAGIIGTISLRTRGVYFIMITMALTQMIYYLAVSAEGYGSDDGLVIYSRSDFGMPWYDLEKPLHLYYTIFICLLISMYLSKRIISSHFGRVIRGAQENEQRMLALGYSVYRYRLVCFIIAGVICGVAGILSANLESFISPDTMYWTASGELIFMVVLGGMGSILGPLFGAGVFWLLAEVLAQFTEHWHIIFGPFLIITVLLARRGIDGLFDIKRPNRNI